MRLRGTQVYQKENTNSGDKHYKLTHFYIDLTFRMLVNIHFQTTAN